MTLYHAGSTKCTQKQKMIKLSAILKRYYKLKYSEMSVWCSKSEELIVGRSDANRQVPTYLIHIPSFFKYFHLRMM